MNPTQNPAQAPGPAPGTIPPEQALRISAENFLCPNCGGTMRWSISRQMFECASCRTPGLIQTLADRVYEHPFEDYAQRASQEVSFPDRTFTVCQNCGAQVSFDSSQTAAVCPMCASSQVNLQKQEAGVPPDGIIPFRVDRPQAQENFKKWVKSRWFAPNKLKKAYQDGKLTGIYLPFWTFDADAEASYMGQGGRTVTRTDSEGRTHTTTVWTPVSGFVASSFNDVPVCASQDRVQTVLDQVLPYNTSEGSLPYAGAYLSGFEAQRYVLGADEGLPVAQQKMEAGLRRQAEMDILSRGFESANVFSLNAHYSNIHYKHVLLPAWTSSFAFGGKEYLYAINGESGRVGGSRPYSVPKILAACLLGLAVVIFFLVFFQDDADAAPLPAPAASNAQMVFAQAPPSREMWKDGGAGFIPKQNGSAMQTQEAE